MSDMSSAIVPKSDQINADDLIGGAMTITIRDVKISGGQEQPVSIYFDGSEKAFRPCKSMSRVLVYNWGPDAKKYIGRSLRLFCDPKVKWGGMEVGGIRISHMSDIDSAVTMALTVTRANKKPFTVKPIAAGNKQPSSAAALPPASSAPPPDAQDAAVAGDPIPEDAALIVDIDKWIAKRKFKAAGDLCEFIKDAALKAATLGRIAEAYKQAAE